jgi:hypothetical protein
MEREADKRQRAVTKGRNRKSAREREKEQKRENEMEIERTRKVERYSEKGGQGSNNNYEELT